MLPNFLFARSHLPRHVFPLLDFVLFQEVLALLVVTIFPRQRLNIWGLDFKDLLGSRRQSAEIVVSFALLRDLHFLKLGEHGVAILGASAEVVLTLEVR